MASLIYNLVLGAAVAAALWVAHRLRTPRAFAWGFSAVAIAGLLLGALFPRISGFLKLRLYAYGVFLHGSALLLGYSILLWRRSRRWSVACAAALLVLGAVGIDAFLVEPKWLEVSHVRLVNRKVPRPLKIAVVSDLQTDEIGDYERGAIRRAMEEKPDLILMPGDYLQTSDPAEVARFRELMQILAAPLGVYAVQGNCENPGWEEMFRDTGVIAVPRSRAIDLDGIRITALDLRDSFDRRISVAPADRFHIVVGHAPDFALGDVRADLLVAGHTHGGQVRLPFVGPLITLSAVPRAWAAGVTDLGGGRTLVVSRGIGHERADAPRLRFLCRPEIVILEVGP